MIRRDELLRHAGVVTAAVVVSTSLSLSGAQAQTLTQTAPQTQAPAGGKLANEARPMDTIAAPREILPWRRDIEQRADAALAAAERALAGGLRDAGERQLADLVRDYPKTYAGQTARERLERLRQAALWRGGAQHGGLGVTGQIGRDDGDTVALAPVAGWRTVVQHGTGNLLDDLIEAAGDRVFFEAGSAKLTTSAKRVLDKQARWLKAQRHVEFKIIGHADDEGSGSSNLRLSHDRAVAVRRYLSERGISGNRLHVVSFGNAQPIAICTVSSCAAQNRRVVSEIRLRRQAYGVTD